MRDYPPELADFDRSLVDGLSVDEQIELAIELHRRAERILLHARWQLSHPALLILHAPTQQDSALSR
jgi:hypothetical protein